MQFLLLPFQRYCNKNSILRFYLSIFGRTNCFGITFSRFLCQHHKALSFWFLKQSFVIFCCLNHSRILLWDGIVQSVCGDLKKKGLFWSFFLTGSVLSTCTIYTLYMRNYCPFSPGASLAVAGNIVLTQITTESRVHELLLALRRCCSFTNQRASWDPEAGICSMVPPH